MLIKLKTISESVKQERIRLKIERGYSDSTLRTIRREALLEYIPFEYFGKLVPVNKTYTEQGYTWYYIGNENWGVSSRFVEYVVDEGERNMFSGIDLIIIKSCLIAEKSEIQKTVDRLSGKTEDETCSQLLVEALQQLASVTQILQKIDKQLDKKSENI